MLSALILIASFCAPGEAALNLKSLHPDEPAEYTFNTRFSIENALEVVDKLGPMLVSFRKLTEATRGKLTAKQLKAIGNTEADTQSLGFTNAPRAIKGTLLKQDYLIKKLRFELAVQQSKTDPLAVEKATAAEKEYLEAEKTFQNFWNSFKIAD